MSGVGEPYTCEVCKGEFVKAWPDDRAAAEHETVFGAPPEDDAGLVCDDCYKRVIAWAATRGLTVGEPFS